MTPSVAPPNQREREILDVLIHLHGEYGLDKQFTTDAIAFIAGPCAGSLAGLALQGYVQQRSTPEGIAYAVLEPGYALFAGIEGQV